MKKQPPPPGLEAALINAPPKPPTKAPSKLIIGRKKPPLIKVVAPTPTPPVIKLKNLEASTKIPILRGSLNYIT